MRAPVYRCKINAVAPLYPCTDALICMVTSSHHHPHTQITIRRTSTMSNALSNLSTVLISALLPGTYANHEVQEVSFPPLQTTPDAEFLDPSNVNRALSLLPRVARRRSARASETFYPYAAGQKTKTSRRSILRCPARPTDLTLSPKF